LPEGGWGEAVYERRFRDRAPHIRGGVYTRIHAKPLCGRKKAAFLNKGGTSGRVKARRDFSRYSLGELFMAGERRASKWLLRKRKMIPRKKGSPIRRGIEIIKEWVAFSKEVFGTRIKGKKGISFRRGACRSCKEGTSLKRGYTDGRDSCPNVT